MSGDASSISSVEECKGCGFHYDSRVRAPVIVCQ
jgi:tetratricopeptide (TPR) repeat protein